MLLSVALIILTSLFISQIFVKLKLPGIIGMLLAGIILGPFVLNLIDPSILNLSTDLRQVALIVILVRAGLVLELDDLKKVGRPAIFLAFIPATIELLAITFLAPLFFDITTIEALILGSIVAAVSPAVVVPRMIKLMEGHYGIKNKIPQLILAGASIDDVYVIVLFASFIQAYQTNTMNIINILLIPVSIILGIILGIFTGLILVKFFRVFHIRDTIKVLILFSFAFLFMVLEQELSFIIPISGLIAVITLGGTILKKYDILAKRLVGKFEKIWVIAEIMLFVLVGTAVDITVLVHVGLLSVLLIISALLFRMIGVFVALIKTKIDKKEKLFIAFSYTPKATVQAAIGAIPLSLGIASGNLMLSIAVLAIIITAPLGAILMDKTYKKLLIQSK